MKKKSIMIGMFCTLLSVPMFAQDVVNSQTAPVATTPTQRTDNTAEENQIAIVGFKRLENDVTARVRAPKRDQNGELCAIIKVVTKDKNLFFEPDALGITAREDQPGEIWLYVPYGARRITIKHERFGIIRNYFYEEPIDKAVVYELQLYVPEVKQERIVIREEIKVTEQSLMMNYSPTHAQIYIDDKLQETNQNGAFTLVLPLGQHSYRVEAPHYKTETGSFDIVPERLTALNVAIRPQYGFLKVTSNKHKTNIFLNGEKKGRAPYASDTLNIGKYTVRAERAFFAPQEKEIEILPQEKTDVDFILQRQIPNIFLLAQMGNAIDNNNQTSFGVMAGVCRKGGAYVQFRTNGNFGLSNELIQSRWGIYNGNSKKYHMAITVGCMVRLMKYAYLYAGGGYLKRGLGWELADGSGYHEVINNSAGLIEGGLIGRYKCFALSLGYTTNLHTPDRSLLGKKRYKEITFGLGYVFGR
ncbi:MAG: PEGA domain-containing protein [Bacteroides sp.]|nr:PEGA domain-containing protein [Bacteroides sp.]